MVTTMSGERSLTIRHFINQEILSRHHTVLFILLFVPISFQFSTLIGMWIIPLLLCLKNQWWRFLFLWLLFSCITSLVVRKAIQKPIEGTTPRFVNIFYNNDSLLFLQMNFEYLKSGKWCVIIEWSD